MSYNHDSEITFKKYLAKYKEDEAFDSLINTLASLGLYGF